MNLLLSLSNIRDLGITSGIPIQEILLQTSRFSKTGIISDFEIEGCVKTLQKVGKKVTLNWDIACTDTSLTELEPTFQQILPLLDSVRYRDPGLGYWLKTQFPKLDLQMSLENFSLNLNSIQQWVRHSSKNTSRIILSNQIPISEIKKWRSNIDTEIEILGLGPLEGFNSARRLIRSQHGKQPDSVETPIESKDRIQNRLKAIDNEHGTTLQFNEEIFLLDELDLIESAGVDHIRLNVTEQRHYQLLFEHFPTPGWHYELRKHWSKDTTKGFFHENKSDANFNKLTNQTLESRKREQIGRVIDMLKQKYTLIETQQAINLPAELMFMTPNALQVPFTVETLNGLDGETYSDTAAAGLYKLPWIKHAVPATAILFKAKIDGYKTRFDQALH